jgi:hypothetical protein
MLVDLAGLSAKAQPTCGRLRDFQVRGVALYFMQNSGVATPPDKSNPADRKPPSVPDHDFFLDPLPVPHATESNTDTAWGLWEHTLRSYEEEAQREPDAKPTDFADTIPAHMPPVTKKP